MDSSFAALLTERFPGSEDPRNGRVIGHELICAVVIAIRREEVNGRLESAHVAISDDIEMLRT